MEWKDCIVIEKKVLFSEVECTIDETCGVLVREVKIPNSSPIAPEAASSGSGVGRGIEPSGWVEAATEIVAVGLEPGFVTITGLYGESRPATGALLSLSICPESGPAQYLHNHLSDSLK